MFRSPGKLPPSGLKLRPEAPLRNSPLRPLYIVALLGLALGLLLLPRVTLAQPATPSDDDVNRVAKQLYCPVCENIPLDVCPTQACVQWRATIREKLAEGWSDEQIKAYFADQYGDRVLAAPPARGLNWLVYILPPVGLLVGGFIVYRAVRSWQAPGEEDEADERAAGPEAGPAPGADEAYISRLESELRRRK
ncbi:MAG: cytochrome c-type biogenesis protein CcmH [Chloroflexi bacterium]|nr:cytochrome c-type biogenesis protein CcmH [Chloroflexota bacterium]